MNRYLHAYLLTIALFAAAAGSPAPARAAGAESIEDLLTERWFEIEVIIFERLDVLDVNTSEALTLRDERFWPNNLLEFGSFLPPRTSLVAAGQSVDEQPADESAGTAAENPLARPSPFCLGYPALPYEDPLHPLLLPEADLPDDVPGLDLDLVDADQDAVDTDTPADDDTLDTAVSVDAPASANGALPPLNAPELSLTPYLRLLADVAKFEDELYATSFRWLDDLTMTPQVKALNRRNNLRPLLHGRWRQPVPERAEPQPIYISSGIDADSPPTHAGLAKLEGFLEVTVGRYLHFAPRLWYHADNLGLAPIIFPARSDRLPDLDDRLHMELFESRRLRSGDLHYLDHPKIGVIVRIDPIEIPVDLVSAWESLAEPSEDNL